MIKILSANEEKIYPIHIAARKGLNKLIPILCKKFKIDQRDSNGKTPLFVAIEEGQYTTVKTLIKNCKTSIGYCSISFQGVKIDFSDISYAVRYGEIECFDILIEHVKDTVFFKIPIKEIGNLLHIAIHFGNLEMLQHLLNKYPEQTKPLLEEKNIYKQTPLILATCLDDLEAVSILLKKGANLEGKGLLNRTAMHFAVVNKNKAAIEFLYRLGAKIEPKDTNRKTPLDLLEKSNDILSKAIKTFLINLSNSNDNIEKSPPNFSFRPPKNLVFQGGGAKGAAYLGAIESLSRLNRNVPFPG